jgi:hypothetical protein
MYSLGSKSDTIGKSVEKIKEGFLVSAIFIKLLANLNHLSYFGYSFEKIIYIFKGGQGVVGSR